MTIPQRLYARDLSCTSTPIYHRLLAADTLYIDIETFGSPPNNALDVLTNRIRLVGLATDAGDAVLFDMQTHAAMWGVVQDVVQGKLLVGHNLAFDLACLVRTSLVWDHVADTMIASQVLCAGHPDWPHTLAACVDRYLDQTLVKGFGASDWSNPQLSPEQIEYAFDDIAVLPSLYCELVHLIDSRGLRPVYDLECAFLEAVVAMTHNGVGIDVSHWTARAHKAEATMREVDVKLKDAVPLPPEEPLRPVRYTKKHEPYVADLRANEKIRQANESRAWNWGSWQQVLQALQTVGVVMPDTSYETLTRHRHDHPAVGLLLAYRDVQKEATAFGVDWLKHVRTDLQTSGSLGRVHPKWWQLGAQSGRMSCSEPNLQQTPRGECRKGVRADDGKMFVRADYSQIEARIAARISGDATMLALFCDPAGDIHAYTAGKVLGKPQSEVTKAERQTGKSLVFGLLFGMSAESLREYCRVQYDVHLSPIEAELYRNRFFQTFPGLAGWHTRVRRVCDSSREFRTLLGRRRIVTPDIGNKFGLGVNHPVQGTAGDLLKLAVVQLWQDRTKFPHALLVMLIHDEVVYEVPEEQAQDFATFLHDTMVDVGNRVIAPVPVEASVKIGKTWGG